MIPLLLATLRAEAGTLRLPDYGYYAAGTEVRDVQAAPDGRTFAFLEAGSDALWVVRTDTWYYYTVQPCDGLVGLAALDNGYAVGCADGGVAFIDTSLLAPFIGEVVPDVAGTRILGLTADPLNVYVVAENEAEGGNPVVLGLSRDTHLPLDTGWPSTLGYPGYEDSETTGPYVIISQGSDNVSKVETSTGSASVAQSGVEFANCTDVDATEVTALLACDIGIVELTPSTSDLQLVLGQKASWAGVKALWIDELEDQLWFVDSDLGLFVYGYDHTSGTVTDDLVGTVGGSVGPSEMSGIKGYGLLGTTDGYLLVFTANPWIYAYTDTKTALNGQVVNVTFQSDIEGDYQVIFAETELASGHVLANTEITVPVTISDAFIEGENVILVSVIDESGDQGHGGVIVVVNNPPTQVLLQEGDLGWGDEKLILTFGGIDDEDLASYNVYVSATKFDPADYPTGTPTNATVLPFTALPGEPMTVYIEGLTNETTYYVAVRAIDATGLEGPMSEVLSGTPHETFTAAELSGDAGGYGCASSRTHASIGALALVGLAALRRRRGVVAALALLALGGTARAQDDESSDESSDESTTETTETTETSTETTTTTDTTPTTTAATSTTVTTTATPETPAPIVEQPVPGTVTVVSSERTPWVHAGLEVRFGPMWFDDVGSGNNPLTDVYGESGNNVLLLEAGPSIKDVLQLEFGIGRYHRKGYLVAEGGEQSSDESVITLYPLTVGGRLRLDFIREQWIVPTVAGGLDYWLWSEKAGYDTDTLSWDAKNSGGHYGYHYAGGIQILLDAFEPKRASQLEARAGIEDSYIVAEYRHREVGEQEDGFKFTGSEVTVGLRIAY